MIYNKLEGTSSTSFKLGKSGIILEQDLDKGLLVVKKGDQIITIGMGVGDADIRDQDIPNLAKITSDINNAISTLNSDIEKHLIKDVYFDNVQKNKLVIEFNGEDISDIEVEFGVENIQGLETLIDDNINAHDVSSEAHSDIRAKITTDIGAHNIDNSAHADIRSIIYDHILDNDNPHTVNKAQVGLANVDDTSDINKPVSTATSQKISTDISTHNTSSIAHADIRNKITTDISAHNISSEAHADMREQISDLEAEIDRIDGKGKSYGEIDYTQTQLENIPNDVSRNLAITDDVVGRFPGYTPSNGDLIYTKESAGENVHEWEYNSSISGWVDNGAYVVQRATNSTYGIVKGGQYISVSNGEMTTLRSQLLGGVGDTYSFTSLQLHNILDGKESLDNKTINWNSPNDLKYPTALLVKTALDSKLDIINSAGAMRAYGIDTNGAAIVHSISNTLLGNSIPIRDVNNQFHVGMATHNNHPVPYNQMVSYVNTEGGKIDVIKVDGTPLSIINKEVDIDLSGKATKLDINQYTVPYRTLSGSGEANTMATVSEGVTASTLALRYTGGRLRVGAAVEDNDAVNLLYANNNYFRNRGSLGATDLNTLNSSDYLGIYQQTSNGSATPENNYPTNRAGSLRIYRSTSGTDIIQEYSTHSNNASNDGVYRRTYFDGTWSDWVKFATEPWVNTQLDTKATKLNIPQFSVPYRSTTGSGETNSYIHASNQTNVSTIAVRYTDGRLRVGDAVETADAVPLGQLDTKLSTLETTLENYVDEFGGKIDVIKVDGTALPITNKEVNIDLSGKATKLNINRYSVPYRYGSGMGEADGYIQVSSGITADTIGYRYTDGRLRVGDAVENNDAVNLGQADVRYRQNLLPLSGTPNWDTIYQQGQYMIAGEYAGTPPVTGLIYGTLEVTVSTGGAHNNLNNWIWQTYRPTHQDAVYYRNKANSGLWSSWKKIANEDWVNNNYILKNPNITAGTSTKITYDSKGLVTGGASLIESDIPTLSQAKITNLTADLASKLNVVTSSTTNSQAYFKTTTGSQAMLNISSTNVQDSLVLRDANNTFHVGTATNNNNPVPLGQLNSALSNKTDIGHTHSFTTITDKPTTIAGYNITNAYTKSEIDGMLESGIKYKGSVADLTALGNIVGPVAGDMYSVISEGNQPYIFDGTSWNEFGGTIDLSAYETIVDNNTKLSNKVDKVTTANRVYATNGSGVQETIPYTNNSITSTLALRYTDGRLRVGTAVENADAVTLGQMNTALDGKGTKLNINQYYIPYRSIAGVGEADSQIYTSVNNVAFSLAQRYTDSRLRVGDAVENADAVTLGQMNTALATKLNSSAKGETGDKTLTFGGTFKVLETLANGTINERIMTMPANPNVNNYLTGVSGSGNDTVTFTRQGLSNLTWDASHTHTMSEIIGLESQFGNAYGTNLAIPDLTGATYLDGGLYRLHQIGVITSDYNTINGNYISSSTGGQSYNSLLFNVELGKQYTLSSFYISGSTNSPYRVLIDGVYITLNIMSNQAITFTPTSSTSIVVGYSSGWTGDGFTFKLQLEKGDTATPYTVPLPFTRKELDDKLTKVSTGDLRRIYGVNSSNAQEMLEVINTTKANTVPFRDTNGNFEIGNATADAHAINRITADGRYAPTTHTHPISEVVGLESQFGNTYGINLAIPNLTGKTEISAGVYRLYDNNGITIDYNVNNGNYTLNGTTTGYARAELFNIDIGTTYTVSHIFIVGTQVASWNYTSLIPTTILYSILPANSQQNHTFTYTTTTQNRLSFEFPVGRTFDNYTFKLQLEKGDTPTPYTVPLPFTRKELDDKLTKVSTGSLRRIYGVNASDAQEMLELINTTKANTVPFRDSNGNFEIGNATADAHAINRITADGRYAPTIHTHSIAQVTNLQTSLNAKENTITAGTTSQYLRGDKTWQTLNKTAVGLGNVDNTTDLNKPVSTATQLALNNKLDTITTSGLAAYTKNGSTQSSMTISSSASANTLAQRTTGGRLKVSTATEDDDAVNKLQMVSYVDGVIESLPNALTYIGAWNANTNTPTLLANNLATKGHVYRVTVAGTRFSIVWEVNDLLVYNNDGNVEKWDITDPTGYEVMSSKITAWGTPTDTQYPSAKLVKDSLDGKLNTVNTINTVYGVNSSGVQVSYTNSAGDYANTIGFRYTDGRLRVGNAVETADSVPLGQLQTMIDEMFSIEIWESGD